MDTVSPSQSVSSNKFQYTDSSDLYKSNDSETNLKAYSDCSSPVSELKTEVQVSFLRVGFLFALCFFLSRRFNMWLL